MKTEETEVLKMSVAEIESKLRELDEKDSSGIILFKIQAL
jgi:hypothetical protein